VRKRWIIFIECLLILPIIPSSAIAVKCDVTVWEDQVAAFEAAITEYGKVDVIVANAGVAEIGQFLGAPLGEDGKPVKPNLTTLDVNLTGVVYSMFL
jgi:NAD(P)-dependent dehydrogenase (short-subunit alcohol dehydrogenase family)